MLLRERADALGHGAQPVGALRREVLVEPERLEHRFGVGAADLLGRTAIRPSGKPPFRGARAMTVELRVPREAGAPDPGLPAELPAPGDGMPQR